MTDSNAIAVLQSKLHLDCSVPMAIKELEARAVAIEALQEREKRSKGCRCCWDASIDPELEGCDLSYHDIGCSEKGYRFLVRAGNRKPVAILFEKWNSDGWHTIGIYEPNNCPVCGRPLKGEQHE